MKQDWSEEPWEVFIPQEGHPNYGHHLLWSSVGERICYSAMKNSAHCFNNKADAERIVACVNACRGIPTELLEKWISRQLKEEDYGEDESTKWIIEALKMRGIV